MLYAAVCWAALVQPAPLPAVADFSAGDPRSLGPAERARWKERHFDDPIGYEPVFGIFAVPVYRNPGTSAVWRRITRHNWS